jgi:HSP20 family molecular chaperone IbpA
MVKRTAELDSLRECIARLRGPVPRTCIGCELSRMIVPFNMYQTDSDLMVKVFLPGVQLDEVSTSVTQDTISIKGEHKEKPEIGESEYFCREYRYGIFNRKLAVPISVQSEKAEVAFNNGVLTLTLPKTLPNSKKV